MRWAMLGGRAGRGRSWPRSIATVVAGLYLGVWAPAHGTTTPLADDRVLLVLAGLVPLVALVASPRRWWPARLVIAALAAGAVVDGYGRTAALWLAASLLLAAWVTADRPPLPRLGRCAPGTTWAMVVVAALAVQVGGHVGTEWQPLAVLAAGWAFAAAGAFGLAPAIAVLDAGRWLGRAAGAVGLAVVGLAVLVARGVASFVVAFDGPAPGPAWEPATHTADPRSRRAGTLGRVSVRTGRVAAVTGLVLFGLFAPERYAPSPSATPSADGSIPAAYVGADWYPAYRRDLLWVTDPKVAWRPLRLERLLDVATQTINVRHGHRVSWTAPACGCRRVTAWLYGGSGAFGLGQRDDHTIASDLARLAAADGIVLDVVNRGQLGQLHWRNATRFSWDLTVDPAPDLVLFYDGSEEVSGELGLDARGLGNTLAPFEPVLTDLYDDLMDVPPTPPAPPLASVHLDGWPKLDDRTRPPGVLAVDRYQRSRLMSEATAAEAGVPARYFWQPNRFAGTTATATGDEAARRRALLGASAALPADVVNLSAVLADTSGPVFVDDSTINEVGAELVAEAMWKDLHDQVAALAGSKPR